MFCRRRLATRYDRTAAVFIDKNTRFRKECRYGRYLSCARDMVSCRSRPSGDLALKSSKYLIESPVCKIMELAAPAIEVERALSWLRDIDRWFLACVLPHAPSYRARATHFCGRDEAEDLVQEAYARVLNTPDHRAIACPRAFVLTIIHNLALERLRRSTVVRIDLLASLDMPDLADPAPDAFAVAAGRSELQHLLAQIEALPPQCARVLHMRKIQGMPPAAIAEALCISLSTVEKHIAKGLALITKSRRERALPAEESWPIQSTPNSATQT